MRTRSERGSAGLWNAGAIVVAALASKVSAQVTSRASVTASGGQATNLSSDADISGDGRFVAFSSYATNLVPGDTFVNLDVFVRDRLLGTTELVTADPGGQVLGSSGYEMELSTDGRYVVFDSLTDNVFPGDANGPIGDVFLHDRQLGTIEIVSVDSAGAAGNDESGHDHLGISDDGRYVTFSSSATNLVPGDTNAEDDIFLRDRQSGTTVRVSVDSAGAEANGPSKYGSLSADGRFVVFSSHASNLVPGDTNGAYDLFVHDCQAGTTERVNVISGGAQSNGDPTFRGGSISGDGRYVALASGATNLVPGDTNAQMDIFVHDRQLGVTERVNLGPGGVQGNNFSGIGSSGVQISQDGRYVAFLSHASNLVPGDTNFVSDAFVHDRQAGTTERATVSSLGYQANDGEFVWRLAISADGRFVLFDSSASNLMYGDTNGVEDIFVRDRAHPGFASVCDPGVGGVIGCPCFNPPSGVERGCDNSAATGGASLSASGGEYISSDTLVFTTSGEKPTALSIVLQGTASIPAGQVYGQGVRCVGGSLKRLYKKSASGGSILAPDIFSGEPGVLVRSAALGDPISAGSTRWYMVYYRDPTVLGGCSAGSTFNCTQTRVVPWLP